MQTPRRLLLTLTGKFIDLSRFVQDLSFGFEPYCPAPKRINGVPHWEKVVPYNINYLPSGGNSVVRKAIDPVAMWLEDRWVLLRRIYGSELVQKLFMHCLTFIYGCNDVKGQYFHEVQDVIVSQLFRQNPWYYFDDVKKDTWIHYWDGSCQGAISSVTAHTLVKQINISGPTAGVFGRNFELFLSEEYHIATCPVETIERSVNGQNGTLTKRSFERLWAPWVAEYGHTSW